MAEKVFCIGVDYDASTYKLHIDIIDRKSCADDDPFVHGKDRRKELRLYRLNNCSAQKFLDAKRVAIRYTQMLGTAITEYAYAGFFYDDSEDPAIVEDAKVRAFVEATSEYQKAVGKLRQTFKCNQKKICRAMPVEKGKKNGK